MQIGYTSVLLLVEVIIGDVTSTRSRLFFSYIPALPFIINTWVSGDVSSATLASTSWRWGIGMFAIIYPVCALPLILALFLAHRRAKKFADLEDYKTPYRMFGTKRLLVHLFWQLDVVGIVLLMAVLALILVPFTVAGGEAATPANWKAAHIVAPLVIGVVLAPFWVLWESKCKHPMVPFRVRLIRSQGNRHPLILTSSSSKTARSGPASASPSCSTSPGTCRATTSTPSWSSPSGNPSNSPRA